MRDWNFFVSKWRKQFKNINKELELNKYLKKSKNHLDFGCGFGVFANILAKKFPDLKVGGFDIDKSKIILAKRKINKKNLKLFNSLPKEKFDTITIIRVFHESNSPEKLVKQVHNLLNSQGKVFVYDFRKVSKKEFRDLYSKGNFEGSFEEEYKEHNKWTLKEFAKIMKSAGFKTIKLTSLKYSLVYIGEKIK